MRRVTVQRKRAVVNIFSLIFALYIVGTLVCMKYAQYSGILNKILNSERLVPLWFRLFLH